MASVVVWAKEAIGQKEKEKEGLQGKKEGVPKDSFMVRFGAIRLATLNSGMQCARQLLAPWLRDVLPYLGPKVQSKAAFLGAEGAKRSAAILGAKGAVLCSFLVAEHARCNNDNEGDSDAADKRRPR